MPRSTRSLCTPYGLSAMDAPSSNADGSHAADSAALQLQERWVIHLPMSTEIGKVANGRMQAST